MVKSCITSSTNSSSSQFASMGSFDYQLNQWLWLLYFSSRTDCYSSTFYLFLQWLVCSDLNDSPLNVYQRIGDMDARGNVTRYELGNGITVNKTYNGATVLLERVNSNRFDLTNIQNLEYSWDDIGNLEHRIERSGSKNLREDFEYDGLNRLTKSTTQSNGQTQEQALTYDLIGNITYKSDVGHYNYGARPHAVTRAGRVIYVYDNNGNNILSSDRRVLSYSTFDKVTRVNKGADVTKFAYGPSRSRYKRVDTNSSTGEVKTTYYLGSVERIEYSGGERSGEREYKRSLGMAIETILYKNNVLDKQETHYLLSDHLGSIDVITDNLANIVQEMSFDAWGQRRNASSWEKLQGTELTNFKTDITTRGYTGHEMVDGVDIIHMNGRIYDARIARFLQADPIIQEPFMTQSLNRYSYVWNNPLNATDPSGYEAFSLLAFIYTAITAATVAFVVSDIIATVGINNGWSQGTIQGLSLIATFIAAIASGGASLATDTIASLTTLQIVQVVAVSGIIGGITSSLQGGKFGHGFISGGIGGYLGSANWFVNGASKGLQSLTKIVIGGTLSEITGGKFVNGAAFAAASVALGLIYGEIKNGISQRRIDKYLRDNIHNMYADNNAAPPGSRSTDTPVKEALTTDSAQKQKIIDNSASALGRYLAGDGSSVELGTNTKSALRNSPEVQRQTTAIRNGTAKNLNDNLSVNLTSEFYHVGRTRVDFSTTCQDTACTINYEGFVDDGFWDPLAFGNLGDGLGGSYEILGGTGYRYNQYNWSVEFNRSN